MSIPTPIKLIICFILSFLLTDAPSALASTQSGPLSTFEVVQQLDRKQAEQKTRDFIQRSDVRNILISRGLSPEEVSLRLASLSDSELQNLAGQIDQVKAGGDILITILIVVLIIFLVKRI